MAEERPEPTESTESSVPPDSPVSPDAPDAQEMPDLRSETPAPDSVPVAEEALEHVEEAAQAVESALGGEPVADGDYPLPAFDETTSNGAAGAEIGLLGDVALGVQVELGRTMMYVEDVLRLNTDSVIELDKAAGDPVDIYVNGRHVARGEVLVLNENFCVRISEILKHVED